MSVPRAVNFDPDAHRVSLLRNLQAALAAHQQETGQGERWTFTVDAVIHLVDGFALLEPGLTRDFLHALATHAATTTTEQMDAADPGVAGARYALLAALSGRPAR